MSIFWAHLDIATRLQVNIVEFECWTDLISGISMLDLGFGSVQQRLPQPSQGCYSQGRDIQDLLGRFMTKNIFIIFSLDFSVVQCRTKLFIVHLFYVFK